MIFKVTIQTKEWAGEGFYPDHPGYPIWDIQGDEGKTLLQPLVSWFLMFIQGIQGIIELTFILYLGVYCVVSLYEINYFTKYILIQLDLEIPAAVILRFYYYVIN